MVLQVEKVYFAVIEPKLNEHLSVQYRVFLCSSGCPEAPSVDQAGLELRDLPVSAS